MPLFLLISLHTGARKSAVLGLKWSDIDLKRGFINYKRGEVSKIKGRSIVPISQRLMTTLKWAKKYGTDIGYVFPNKKGHIKDIKKAFNTLKNKADMPHIFPHVLRHTFATWEVISDTPIHAVAKMMGHTTSNMVEKTYGHLSPNYLKERKSR